MVKAANPPLTPAEILKVTRASVNILKALRYDFCLFGSAASNYYGMNSRVAKDVDIIVLSWEVDREELKETFVQRNKHFFKVASKNPRATYTVLWYELSDERNCKVDLLGLGDMRLPDIPRYAPYYVPGYHEIPLLPLIPLLFLKLIGWSNRAKSKLPHWRRKVPNDEDDIQRLLDIAIRRPDIGRLSSVPWITDAFRRRARARIDRFVQMYPDSMASWRVIGFRFPREQHA
ncbi:hypothetical protein EYR40_004869 [Pleurotus pulmonarius]|nr:hypothetical protein EYR36_006745 [Pleurotus pulmonarius]KAF4601444.1 hypothetical protein EYR38_006097 [Pleurotus pulmonarius]KAF4601670.1 hypothetical protein EYR40_004869 [Pleurotus pulmonarius]